MQPMKLRHAIYNIATGLCVITACLTGACTPTNTLTPDATDLDVWTASDMVALTDRSVRPELPSLLYPPKEAVELFGAANETLAFQIVIDADAAVSGLRIQPGPLRTADGKVIDAQQIRLASMLPVAITDFPAWYLRLVDEQPQPASYYDALLPAPENKAWTLARGERLALWVDVAIPRNASGGTYTGEIRITRPEQPEQTLPIRLDVYDFVLPDARPMPALGAFDHRTLYERFVTDPDDPGQPYIPVYLDPGNPKVAEGLDLVRETMVLGHEHRLDLFDSGITPKIRRDLYGELTLDWQAFDAVVKPYLDGSAFADRIGTPAWPIPYREDYPVPRYYGGLGANLYRQAASQFIDQCSAHFRNLGADTRMFAWPLRDDVSQDAYARLQTMAQIVEQTDAAIPVLSRLPITPPAETGWQPPATFADSVDILAPPGQWLDPTTAKARRIPGRPLAGVWLSPGRPPYVPALSVISTPADVRALPWLANRYGCSAIFLPEVLNWQGDVFTTSAGAETRLFYPGNNHGIRGVLPSVRLKRLRRGMQDTLYLWLLQQRQRPALANMVLNSMVHYAGLDAVGDNYLDPRIGGWAQSSELWIRARRMLAEEIVAAIHPDAESNEDRVLQQVRWVRFLEQTQELRIEQVRALVRPAVAQGDEPLATRPGLSIDIEVDLFNEYNRPLPCRFRLAELPPGWTAPDVQETTLPPTSRQRLRLTASGETLPPQPAPQLRVRLDIAWPQANRRSVDIRVPLLAAIAAPRSPAIDGSLDDWPAERSLGATAFRLLGRRGTTGEGLAQRQTAAYVMQDAAYLYIAVICEEPDPAGMTSFRDNHIRYDQLLAGDEDLVEVILDPGRQATGPEGLFHFVIKPNGVLVQERGIGSQPPLGQATPLASRTRLAVGRNDLGWTAELRIPRETFGHVASSYWGMNVTRYATQGAEASNWAGAERYYYAPQSLGTLFVPQPPRP